MNRNLVSIVLILFLMGFAAALDVENGVEMRPGEAAAEKLFEKGIGHPWVGGNPFSNSLDFKSFDYPSNMWGWRFNPLWGYGPFSYYAYQGKTYNPYRFSYYDHQGKTYRPYHSSYHYDGYWWPR
jgi:hypothetical protein